LPNKSVVCGRRAYHGGEKKFRSYKKDGPQREQGADKSEERNRIEADLILCIKIKTERREKKRKKRQGFWGRAGKESSTRPEPQPGYVATWKGGSH